MTPAKLNMGSGPRSKVGFVNADLHAMAGVDLLCNFSRFPWPFKDSVFDEVHATDVIEHLPDTVRVMEEIHRVTRPGARIVIKVPHYKHANAFKDPTHVRFFTEGSFDYFGKNEYSYYTKARFNILSVEKIHEYHIGKYVKRLFPRLLPWVERYLDQTVESLVFTLQTVK
ncbi:MAG: class I SAM-dependent methyltransferase [Methanobacteriota archaeon]|nr:MAG: class I SAM-dependent methyltransferase [Euryarchaeota archaeon]